LAQLSFVLVKIICDAFENLAPEEMMYQI